MYPLVREFGRNVEAFETERLILRLLANTDAGALYSAANQNPSLYCWTPVLDLDTPATGLRNYVADKIDRMNNGELLAYVVILRASGEIVGCTRLDNLRRWQDGSPYAIEGGGTWLSEAEVNKHWNYEIKRAAMTMGFETIGVERFDFRTDSRNTASRRSLLGLGAREEGTFRSWEPAYGPGNTGTLRDTVVFSILREEWPKIRGKLL